MGRSDLGPFGEGVAVERDYLDFEISIENTPAGQVARVSASPAGSGSASFALPFTAVELAQFMTTVGPPRVASRRLVPAETRVMDVKDHARRLGDALFSGDVDRLFRESLASAKQQGAGLRVRLSLQGAPDLEPVPWEYLYDSELGRFLTLSSHTPVVRSVEALDVPAPVRVSAPLRVLVMISSPSDLPELAVAHEEELLRATTADLVASGRLEIVVLTRATLSELQRALIDTFHVFHFIGHGGFDQDAGEGVLVLEREDGTSHRVGASRLGTLLHDANGMQLVVLNACEGARTSGRDAFSGVAQALVRQGLPAVVAMQTEISDRAALVFSHEFYYFLTRGLPIDAAICEVRKAMATSDEAAEWGTAVLVRSGSDQPFDVSALASTAEPAPEGRLESLYAAAQSSLASPTPHSAVPILEQIAAERPDYADVTLLLEAVKAPEGPQVLPPPTGPARTAPTPWRSPAAPPPLPPGTTPPPSGRPGIDVAPRRRTGSGWKWLAAVLAALLLAVIAFIIWAAVSAEDPPPLAPGAGPDPVTVACGPASDIPRPEGALLVACAPTAPDIDGRFGEWAGVEGVAVDAVIFPESGANPNGVTAQGRLLWTKDALFVHMRVRDPQLTPVSSAVPKSYWTGDGISFEFGPDPRSLADGDRLRRGQDLHVLIGLADSDQGALAAINRVGGDGTFSVGDRSTEIDVERRNTADGYEVEARVPWLTLGLARPPAIGTVVGINLNVSDARSRSVLGTMVSSNPERTAAVQNFPRRWQTAVLGDAR